MAEQMKRCHLCGKLRESDLFMAAHCIRCDKLMDFGPADLDAA